MIHAPRVLTSTLLLAACGLSLAAESAPAAGDKPAVNLAAAAATEPMTVDGRQVKVLNKQDVTIPFKTSDGDDIASCELWYSSFDGVQWSSWTRHPLTFARGTPMVWSSVPEGHWRIYVRPFKASSLSAAEPSAETHAKALTLSSVKEFIIDRTRPEAVITTPVAGAKLRGGETYPIRWTVTDPYLRSNPITIDWSRDGKSWENLCTDRANNGSFDWVVGKDMTPSGILRLTATDKAGNVATVQNASIIVDSINPRGRITGPAISARQEVTLSVEVGDAGPAGLAKANLWVSQDNGTSWVEGPAITDPYKQVAWKAPADGEYRLYILAVDQAGNPSPTPKGKAEDQFVLIVDTTKPTVTFAWPIGVAPANTVAPTKTAFPAGERMLVNFTIKDNNLLPDSAAIFIQTDPAKGWTVLAENQSTDRAYSFQLPAVQTRTARIKVTARDRAGNVGETITSEAFQIDTEVGPVQIDDIK